jgi:hypothetical protein
MAWLWRSAASPAAEGEESEASAAAHREANAVAMATMRDLCQDLINPDPRRVATPEPANAHDEEGCILPAADLDIPHEATLQRFLTGYELDAHVAAKRLRRMLKWRASHSYGLDETLVRDISSSTPGVQQQIATGKCYILAQRDKRARPIIVVHVRRHDPSKQTQDELSRFGVHILESAERMLQEPDKPAVNCGDGAAEPSPGVPETEGSERAMEPDKLLIIFYLVSHSRWHGPPCPALFFGILPAMPRESVPSPAEVSATVDVLAAQHARAQWAQTGPSALSRTASTRTRCRGVTE